MKLGHLWAAGLLLLLPSLASAGMRPWLSGSLGGSTYAMGDVNDDIGFINDALAGTGLQMDEVGGGLNLGVAAGLDAGGGFSFGLAYDRLQASSDVGDFSGSIEYDLPGNLLRAFGRYTFVGTGPARGFLEASLGRITPAGGVTLTVTGSGSVSGDFEGSGVAFEGGGGLDFWTTRVFALTGSAGYRRATVGDVEIEGIPIFDATGDRYEIDYSGLFVRVGLKVALAP